MDEKVRYWLDLADYDFETAKAMLETKRFLYVGFMCHQVIEKSLKAVIAKNTGELPPKIHNLIRLSELSGKRDGLSEEHLELLRILSPLNIESRYPEYKKTIASGLTEEICMKLTSETEELLCWIKKQLSIT